MYSLFQRDRIFCGECGELYGPKVWHSNDPYRKTVWRCNGKYENKCGTPTLHHDDLRRAFESVLATLGKEKDEIVKNLNSLLTAPEQLETKRDKLIARRDAAADKANEAIKKRAKTGAGADKYKPLAEKYTKLDEEVKQVEREIAAAEGRRRRIEEFVAALEAGGTEYSDELWCTMVEKVTVYAGWMVFTLVTGQEIRVERG